MRLSTQLMRTVGWLRLELATVAVSELELRELRERDVLLVDARTLRSDRGESGPALLVLDDGRRYAVTIELRAGSYFATVVEPRADSDPADAAAINLVHREFDSRESHALEPGSSVALNVVPADPLVVSWRDEVKARGRFVEVDGRLGVAIEAP